MALISYTTLCPGCIADGKTDSKLNLDTDSTPLAYICDTGAHTYAELPDVLTPGEPAAPEPVPMPQPISAEELPAEQRAQVEAGEEIAQSLTPPPSVQPLDTRGANETAAPLAEVAYPPPTPATVEDLSGAERAQVTDAFVQRMDRVKSGLRVGVVPDDDNLGRIMESLPPVRLQGGDVLIVARLPERVAIDVEAQAAIKGKSLKDYMDAALTAFYDLEYFQNVIPS